MYQPKIIKKKLTSPTRMISLSFAGVILVGTFLLMLPASSRDGSMTHFLDCLFTSTSATCVTGLVVYDTFTHWSVFGQIVILAMIQCGGLGLVTFTTFFNLFLGRKLGLRGMQLASESVSAGSFGETPRLVRMVILFSLLVEAAGACLLGLYFVPQYGARGIFISVFLAISAFCNAGFDILGFLGEYTSLTTFNGNYWVLFVIMALIIIGGLGFLVWSDIIHYRRGRKLLLHTKIVLLTTGLLLIIGFVLFLVFEWDNPATLGQLTFPEKLNASLFQSVTLRTAGFNSVDIASLREITKSFSILIMFIGAAPGSTGGGIKVTTLTVVIMTAVSMIRGKEEPIIFKRRIPAKVVYKSLAIMFLGVLVVSVTSIILTVSSPIDDIQATGTDAVFEAVSAFATVGISAGVTGIASIPSLLAIIVTMFIGRVGPVSFGMTLTATHANSRKEILPEGKIIVG